MGAVRLFLKSVRNLILVFLVLGCTPGLPPHTHFPVEPISFPALRPLTGQLQPNNRLDNAEQLLRDAVHGPETVRVRDNLLYTSTADGLWRIDAEQRITRLGRIGADNCASHEPEVCGLTAGFAFDSQHANTIIAADAYHGIWSLNLDTMHKTHLLRGDQLLPSAEGTRPRRGRLFNALAVSARTGDIYFTDTASDFAPSQMLSAFVANPSGRLFRLDRRSGHVHLLADRLHCANGVVLSPDEQFALVSETAASRVTRIHLSGPRAGEREIFVDALPGAPDNLSADADGVWLALPVVFDAVENPPGQQLIGEYAILRRAILRLFALMRWPFERVADVTGSGVLGRSARMSANWLGSFNMLEAMGAPMFGRRSMVVQLSWEGRILGAAFGEDGSSGVVTHAEPVGDWLYLGSFVNAFVARVPKPRFERPQMVEVDMK